MSEARPSGGECLLGRPELAVGLASVPLLWRQWQLTGAVDELGVDGRKSTAKGSRFSPVRDDAGLCGDRTTREGAPGQTAVMVKVGEMIRRKRPRRLAVFDLTRGPSSAANTSVSSNGLCTNSATNASHGILRGDDGRAERECECRSRPTLGGRS